MTSDLDDQARVARRGDPRRTPGPVWFLLALWLIVGLISGMIVEHKFGGISRLLGASPPTPNVSREASSARPDLERAVPVATVEDRLVAAIERILPSVVSIVTYGAQRRRATGIVYRLDADGNAWIVTNDHVLRGATTVSIDFGESVRTVRRTGSEWKGGTIVRDGVTDLAAIRVDAPESGVVAIALATKPLRAGMLVAAVGHPFALRNSATLGIVSATDRSNFARRAGNAVGGYADLIQHSAPIALGASGGPLVNLDGELVGVNIWTLAPEAQESTSDTEGGVTLDIDIGFAIPAAFVRRIIDDLIGYGSVHRAALGIRVESGRRDGVRGVAIQKVIVDTPADRAGLLVGDFVVALDEQRITGRQQLATRIAHCVPGQHVVLTVLRKPTSPQAEEPEILQEHEIALVLGELVTPFDPDSP